MMHLAWFGCKVQRNNLYNLYIYTIDKLRLLGAKHTMHVNDCNYNDCNYNVWEHSDGSGRNDDVVHGIAGSR